MILVTGSDGIVGRVLCKKLQKCAVPFLPVTHRRKPHTLPQALLVDLANDLDSLAAHRDEVSAIVHLAAAVPHSASYPDNRTSAGSTRRIDRNIRSLQKQIGVPVIYMSACSFYDKSTTNIKHEDDRFQMRVSSPYLAAKAEGESLFFSKGNSTILRLSSPVGVGLKPQLVLSRFVATARKNGMINVWGNGSREQDFIDTADVADLILRILNKPKTMVLNAASGVPITMLKLAETVVSVVGAGSVEKAAQPDPRDGETARYAICRAKDHYNWMPQRSLEDSVAGLISENFEANA